VRIIEGDCVASIEDIANEIPPHGLNFALIDPFGPSGLRWSVLERLARFPRMDLLIHFPTGSLKRNLHNHPDFNQMVGTSDSLSDLGAHDVGNVMEHLRENLAGLGYTGEQVRRIDIRNSKQTILYHLFFASKIQLADKIWSSIAKVDAHGQRSLF
jgi:three-Cys-motif partner protein